MATGTDETKDLALIARTVAAHEAILLAFRDELVELRRVVDQTTIRLRCLERRGQEPKREGQ